MSTNVNPVPVETPASGPERITIARNLFNLDTFQRESKEKEIVVKTVDSMEAILEATDGDESKAVKIFNAGYKRSQITEAKREMGSASLVSPKAVRGIVDAVKMNYVSLPPAERETAALDHIRRTPALVAAAKAIALVFLSAVTEEDDDAPGE